MKKNQFNNLKNSSIKKQVIKLIIILFLFSLEFIDYLYLSLLKIPIKLLKKLINLENNDILRQYINEQIDFCNNPQKYFNKEIEDNLELTDINFRNISFRMYTLSNNEKKKCSIKKNHLFEEKESINMLEALKFYSKVKRISYNKDIYILDIGGNVGWYPSLFGLFNYSILTFEPKKQNYYTSRKNFCYLNRESNIIIITKGISIAEKICDYYDDSTSINNGMVLCNNNLSNSLSTRFKKIGEVSLTRLSNFIPYLSNKNLALIKIDVEGSEGDVINSGIDLITKYSIPFIFIEFTPSFLVEHNTDPKKFLEFFVDNGYKISINGFLSKNFISAEELIKMTKFQINTYFIHQSVIIYY